MLNLEFVKSIFTAGFAIQGILNKDLNTWLYGARLPQLVLLVLPLPENEFDKVIIFWWYHILLNWEFVKSIFMAGFASQGVLTKDSIDWIYEARLSN